MKKDLSYYRSLPYTRCEEVVYENRQKPLWITWIQELPGCKTDGISSLDANKNLDIAFDDYIETMLENELDIPEPVGAEVNQDELVIISNEFIIEENSSTKNLMDEHPQMEWIRRKQRRKQPSSVSSSSPSPRPELQYAL